MRKKHIYKIVLISIIGISIILFLKEGIKKNIKLYPTNTISQKNQCGGWDTSGEILCECDGNLVKPTCPAEAVCDAGIYYCEGACGNCCYKGIAENPQYPKCPK